MGKRRRKRTDRLFESPRRRRLGPREEQADEIIRARPGIAVNELADEMGVSLNRIWQIINRLEFRDRIVVQPRDKRDPE